MNHATPDPEDQRSRVEKIFGALNLRRTPRPEKPEKKLLSALRLASSEPPHPAAAHSGPYAPHSASTPATPAAAPDRPDGADAGFPAGRFTPALASASLPEPKIRMGVFITCAVGILAIALWAALDPHAWDVLSAAVTWVSNNFGWFYILTGTVIVIYMIIVAAGSTGHIRLGPNHSRPQYSLYSWAAMLFAAGIGVDLLFFSVAEPVYQYYHPPTGNPETIEAAHQAVVLTMFHYGITGWAMYAMMGMAFGYFAYRFDMPLTIRSALYPIFGKRIRGVAGDAVDVAAMLGTVFGVATSLGIGVVQLNYGLRVLFNTPENLGVQSALVAVAVITATISAVSGVDKGIKRLSQLNVGMAIALGLYILFTGRTSFLANSLVANIGEYFSSFPSMTLETYAFTPDIQEWMNSWTVFFWAWWVAWAPFIGLFLARISRGRTLRQFVIGTFLLPFAFIVLWISIFGNSALDRVVNHNDSKFGHLAVDHPEQAFYLLLEQYPLAPAVMLIASIIGLLLYITSADSAALVMSNFTSRITNSFQDGPRRLRVFWALATGILTIAMLKVGGIPTLQMATILAGLPFAIVFYLIMWGLYRSLRLEKISTSAAASNSTDRRTLTQRLTYAVSYPTKAEVTNYQQKVAFPALQKVEEALREQGVDVTLTEEEILGADVTGCVLTVETEKERPFRYELCPVSYPMPSYAMRANPGELYYRLEVLSLTGSLGYDVMGYTDEQILADVVDRWEEYLEFLRLQSPMRGSSDISGAGDTALSWEEDF